MPSSIKSAAFLPANLFGSKFVEYYRAFYLQNGLLKLEIFHKKLFHQAILQKEPFNYFDKMKYYLLKRLGDVKMAGQSDDKENETGIDPKE